MPLNTVLLATARSSLQKRGFVPPQAAAGQAPHAQGQPGTAPPGMDPAAAGGMPPADPAMAGGQPPMDPAAMGGQAAAPPADPAAAAGGAPPPAGGGQDVMSALSIMLDEKLKALNPAAAGADGAGGAAKPKAAKPQPATVSDLKRVEKLLAGLYEASGTPLPYSIMQDDNNEEGAAPAGGSPKPAAAPK